MARRSTPLRVPRGATVFAPGQPCPGFVVLHAGTIRVTLTAENGREVVLYRVRPGDVCLQTFSCLVNDEAYSAEGVAETDVDGTLLSPGEFRGRISDDPEFRDTVFAAVARRFADFEQLVEDVALIGFDARLARALLRLRDAQGRIAMTHEALAGEIASGRAVVSRRLAEFARRGLVALGRGTITVTDQERLTRIAEDDR